MIQLVSSWLDLMGIFAEVSSVFFHKDLIFLHFLVLKITFPCEFVDNLISQKFCGMFCKAPQ
jgi:hypothetical protein